MAHWLATGAALVMALAALARARTLGRRLQTLTQNYWELRYQHGELRAHLRRLDPDGVRGDDTPPPPTTDGAFIPLSALKR